MKRFKPCIIWYQRPNILTIYSSTGTRSYHPGDASQKRFKQAISCIPKQDSVLHSMNTGRDLWMFDQFPW